MIPFYVIELGIGLIVSLHYSYRALRHDKFKFGKFTDALFTGFAWSSVIGVICYILYLIGISIIEITLSDLIPPVVGCMVGLSIYLAQDHLQGLIDEGLMNPFNMSRRFFPIIDPVISFFANKPSFTLVFFGGLLLNSLSLIFLKDISIYGSTFYPTAIIHFLLLIMAILYLLRMYHTHYKDKTYLKAIFEYINKQTLSLYPISLAICIISTSILRIVINVFFLKGKIQITFPIIDIIIISVLTPITEEIIFRGMLQSELGINISTALYTLIHVPRAIYSTKSMYPLINPLLFSRYTTIGNNMSSSINPIFIIFYLFQIYILGLIFGIIKKETNIIILSTISHFLYNLILLIFVFNFTSIIRARAQCLHSHLLKTARYALENPQKLLII